MKILICNNFKLENKGGAPGYLYNLSKFVSEKIEYLDNYNCLSENNIEEKRIKKILKKCVFLYDFLRVINLVVLINTKIKDTKIQDEKPMLHYHSTLEFYKSRNFLKKSKQIKILTTHSPQPASEELAFGLSLKNKFLTKLSYKLIKKFDVYSLKMTDYLIFPCKEAMEPYLTRDQEIRDILQKKLNKNKVKFLPTGIIDKKIDFQKDYFFKKFGIPKEAVILCYLGRHNEIKGYDLLVKMGKHILEKNENVYILVGGQLNPDIEPLKHERWIELGWTSEGDNIMRHAHAYLLPNRETYFDLVFIEALRAGATIICSETGGNKYFKKFESSEIIYFEKENINNFIEVINRNMKKFQTKDYVQNRIQNRSIYENEFTVKKFGENYITIMEEIYDESKKLKK